MFEKFRLSFFDIFIIFLLYFLGKCLLIIIVSFFVSGIVNGGIFFCRFVKIFGVYFRYFWVILSYFFFGVRLRLMV